MYIPYSLLSHLFLQGEEEVSKPLKGSGLGADPVEVDLLETDLGVVINQLVEDGLEDGGKWSHSDASTYQNTHFTIKHILRGREGGGGIHLSHMYIRGRRG